MVKVASFAKQSKTLSIFFRSTLPKYDLVTILYNSVSFSLFICNPKLIIVYGAGEGNRTPTPRREPDFESGASTSSATPAIINNS